MDKAQLERYLEEGLSLSRIGEVVGKHPSTVGYWIKRHGLEAVGKNRYAPKGGLPRSTLDPLVARGLTLREMSERLSVSIGTVRYWLARYDLKPAGAGRLGRSRRAIGAGRKEVLLVCRQHGSTVFTLDATDQYRCRRCRVEHVTKRRRVVKAILVEEAGGRCVLCGYDRYQGALEFHHLDPSDKAFELSMRGLTRGIDSLRAEARKCVLLCSNCHAEVEGGIVSLSA